MPGVACGMQAAINSLKKAWVPRSMPLAQTTTGVPGRTADAREAATSRTTCAGTTSSIASAEATAFASAVTTMRGSSLTPGRNGLSPAVLISAASVSSRAIRVTLRPARTATPARAEPQAPAPTTAMRSNVIAALRYQAGDASAASGGGLTTWSSGQRARGAVSSVSISPCASRSAPAHAIIAPLSVHNSAGGSTSSVPIS